MVTDQHECQRGLLWGFQRAWLQALGCSSRGLLRDTIQDFLWLTPALKSQGNAFVGSSLLCAFVGFRISCRAVLPRPGRGDLEPVSQANFSLRRSASSALRAQEALGHPRGLALGLSALCMWHRQLWELGLFYLTQVTGKMYLNCAKKIK